MTSSSLRVTCHRFSYFLKKTQKDFIELDFLPKVSHFNKNKNVPKSSKSKGVKIYQHAWLSKNSYSWKKCLNFMRWKKIGPNLSETSRFVSFRKKIRLKTFICFENKFWLIFSGRRISDINKNNNNIAILYFWNFINALVCKFLCR